MKQITLLIAVLFALCSCTPQASEEKKEMDETAKQNIELVKKYLQAMENEDIETFQAMHTEDATFDGPAYNHYDTLDAELIENQVNSFQNIDSLKYNVVTMLPQTVEEGNLAGNWVLLWCNPSYYSIKHEKSVQIMCHYALRIEDGKINYTAIYCNQWDLYKQLGAELEWDDDEDVDEDKDDD